MVRWDACTAMAIWHAGMPSVLVSTHRTETYQPSSSATPSAAVSASSPPLLSHQAPILITTNTAELLWAGKSCLRILWPNGFCNLLVV